MRAFREFDLPADDDGADGFGPTTDLIISVMAVLLLLLTLARASYLAVLGGNADLAFVAANQHALVESLKLRFAATYVPVGGDGLTVLKLPGTEDELRVRTSATNQRISFGEQVLFPSSRGELSSSGETVLRRFRDALAEHLGAVQEIHIEGHADNERFRNDPDGDLNLRLAADRALAVYRFLKGAGIDPAQNLMSAGTFAEYKPIDREPAERYDDVRLARANRTPEERARNRRIEIVLIYRLAPETRH